MKLFVWFIFLCHLMLMTITSASALTLETQDNPISFKPEILPWEQVNRMIPNKSYFTIVDVETGMKFNVQRRAGNKHADVQPLTYEDTQIMKKIYNGKWSWNRRSILVLTKDQMLAASMHGMPHGAGALKNGFPGHFCVHFYGSTTHGSGNEDLSHKLMILRAGGQLQNYLNEIDPIQVVHVLETAINQGDQKTINMMIRNSNKQTLLHEKLEEIYLVSFDKNSIKNETKDNPLVQHIHLSATIYKHDYSKVKKNIDFVLWRDVISGQWIIDSRITNEF